MDCKRICIVDAATRVILRYGFRRSTMSDYAAEAGVSRQTVYAFYPNKDALLRASIRLGAERDLRELRERCAAATSLETKIDVVFDIVALRPRALLDSAPDASDLLDGINAAAADEVENRFEAIRALLIEIFAEEIAAAERIGVTTDELATHVVRTAVALKKTSRDVSELRALLAVQKAILLRALA